MITEIQNTKYFGIKLFGKKLPFSQGFAVRSVIATIGGTLLQAGQVVAGGPDSGCYIYVKSVKGGRVAESIWFDDGVETASCKFINLGDGWQEKLDGNWVPIKGMKVENLGSFDRA